MELCSLEKESCSLSVEDAAWYVLELTIKSKKKIISQRKYLDKFQNCTVSSCFPFLNGSVCKSSPVLVLIVCLGGWGKTTCLFFNSQDTRMRGSGLKELVLENDTQTSPHLDLIRWWNSRYHTVKLGCNETSGSLGEGESILHRGQIWIIGGEGRQSPSNPQVLEFRLYHSPFPYCNRVSLCDKNIRRNDISHLT